MARKAKNKTKQVNTKPVKTDEKTEVKYDENGVLLEQNVFPPIDDNAEFHGTATAQRIIRRAKEENEKKD